MADTSTPKAAPTPKTVVDDMAARALFTDHTAAANYIAKCQADFADFDNYTVVPVGMSVTPEGAIEFDPAIYTDAMQIAVVKLTERGSANEPSTVKAIVIYPSPTPAAIMANTSGQEWLAGIIAKEINHVAVRNLRKAANAQEMADALESMPTTIEDYTTSSRESTGGILETYNTLWQVIKKGIGEKSKAFRLRGFNKKELRRAMESASYAAIVYPECEDRKLADGTKDSAFVRAIIFGQLLSKAQGLEPAIFDRMLAQRDEKKIDAAAEDDEEGEFDLEAMAAAMSTKPATTPATSEDAEVKF